MSVQAFPGSCSACVITSFAQAWGMGTKLETDRQVIERLMGFIPQGRGLDYAKPHGLMTCILTTAQQTRYEKYLLALGFDNIRTFDSSHGGKNNVHMYAKQGPFTDWKEKLDKVDGIKPAKKAAVSTTKKKAPAKKKAVAKKTTRRKATR